MLTVVQAFDRAPIAEIETDDAAALERKLQAAYQVFRDRDGWLKPHRRIAILRRLAALMEAKRDHLAMQIAREGGKPLPDAIVETHRAIDGVHNAADELRNFAGREIPMGLSAAAENRWAFTTREPIGVVAAISAFAWRAVQCLEDHDVVRWDYERLAPRAPRVPAVADPSNARSWYARSRTRVATVLLLTAPGIPMLFMGQEILEEKPWHDDVGHWSQFLISWEAIGRDRHMQDFLTFMHDLVALRRAQAALRGEGVRVLPPDERNRVIVIHRWVEGEGRDVVVVATLSESTLEDYRVDMPWPGQWREVFNSDFYDHCPNPHVAGSGGQVTADGPGAIYPWSACLRIPANGAIVLARPT